MDTGQNAQESIETLLIQQGQLIRGKRPAQMFPKGTLALSLPNRMRRHDNPRGLFHFNPDVLRAETIDALSSRGEENRILLLGPYSKADVEKRVAAGDKLVIVTERVGNIEIRCAAATEGTLPEVLAFFEQTKEPVGKISVGNYPARVGMQALARMT